MHVIVIIGENTGDPPDNKIGKSDQFLRRFNFQRPHNHHGGPLLCSLPEKHDLPTTIHSGIFD